MGVSNGFRLNAPFGDVWERPFRVEGRSDSRGTVFFKRIYGFKVGPSLDQSWAYCWQGTTGRRTRRFHEILDDYIAGHLPGQR